MAEWRHRLLYAVLAAVIATGGWAWHERDERLRAEGRAEIAREHVETLLQTVDSMRARARADSIRADSIRAAAEREAAEARAEADAARASRPTIVERIITEAGPDSARVRQAVEEVAASYEAETRALRRALAAASATIEAQDTELQSLRATVHAQEQLARSLRAQLEATNRSRPSWLERNTNRVTWALAGAALGYAVAELR